MPLTHLTRLAAAIATLLFAAACSDSTRRNDEEDADVEPDADTPRCPVEDRCDDLGFGADWSFEVGAEVISVTGGRVGLQDDDDQPLAFFLCQLSAEGVLSAGDRVVAHNRPASGLEDCWLGELWREGGEGELLALSIDCHVTGPEALPAEALGWRLELASTCEGVVDQVCTAGSRPVYLALPETLYDVELTVDSGEAARARRGEVTTIGPWQVHLVDARATEAVTEDGCGEPARGQLRLTAVR